jgi:tRNA A37 threonylcarbamoyladenosine modification protein TsaB
VLPVQSLTALAYQAVAISPLHKKITCVIDARMNECYVAQYATQNYNGGFEVSQTSAPALLAYESIQNLNLSTHCVIGNAATVLPQWSGLANNAIDAAPSAQGVLDAALAALRSGELPVLPEHLQPLYVRNQVAFTAAQRLAGLDKPAQIK